MGEGELKKVEETETTVPVSEVAEPTTPPPAPAPVEPTKDVAEEKSVVPHTEPKADDSKAIAVIEKVPEPTEEKKSGGSHDRDIALSRVETEKRMSLIKAWEESEKTKAENKAHKKMSTIVSWENTKKAAIESELKEIEEKLEKKKAEYAEKMKNKIAMIHKEAEERRAMVEAKKGEELLKAEEMAAKYRATGSAPKKLMGCF